MSSALRRCERPSRDGNRPIAHASERLGMDPRGRQRQLRGGPKPRASSGRRASGPGLIEHCRCSYVGFGMRCDARRCARITGPAESPLIGTHPRPSGPVQALVPETAPRRSSIFGLARSQETRRVQGLRRRVSDGTRTRDHLDHKRRVWSGCCCRKAAGFRPLCLRQRADRRARMCADMRGYAPIQALRRLECLNVPCGITPQRAGGPPRA